MGNEDLVGLGYLLIILFCPFIFHQSCVYVANGMVKDRETKMKETLKIMGMKTWIYALGYLVQRGIWLTLPCLFVAFFMYIFNPDQLSGGDAVLFFIMLWLFGFGVMTFIMVFANFFKDSRLISMIVPIVQFIAAGVAMSLLIEPILNDSTNNNIQYFFWFPTFPFTVLMTNLLSPEGQKSSWEVSGAVAWFFLIIQGPLWYFLHLYIEAIMPDNYGISKHPCFCFKGKTNEVFA